MVTGESPKGDYLAVHDQQLSTFTNVAEGLIRSGYATYSLAQTFGDASPHLLTGELVADVVQQQLSDQGVTFFS